MRKISEFLFIWMKIKKIIKFTEKDSLKNIIKNKQKNNEIKNICAQILKTWKGKDRDFWRTRKAWTTWS